MPKGVCLRKVGKSASGGAKITYQRLNRLKVGATQDGGTSAGKNLQKTQFLTGVLREKPQGVGFYFMLASFLPRSKLPKNIIR